MKLSVVILAAGKGKRMGEHSKPKALYELGGEPLIAHVIRSTLWLQPQSIHIVVGYQATPIKDIVSGLFPDTDNLLWHQQNEQLGTADAVACALPAIADDQQVLVAYADMPLIATENYHALLNFQKDHDLAFMSSQLDDPSGYGRVVRAADDSILAIVEETDASLDESAIDEVNIGVLTAKAQTLAELIKEVGNNNQQKEYYLTDCVRIAVDKGMSVSAFELAESWQAAGVNTPQEYELAERLLQYERATLLMEQGAIVKDATRLDVRGNVKLGQDVVLDVGVVLEGEVELGDGVMVAAYTILKNTSIGAGTTVNPFTLVEGARIGQRCKIGPYARIRPDTTIGDDNSVGNFVEIKKSATQDHTKINHLSYIGDSQIGAEVNIGAGVITCNYDGAEKHRTTIGNDVFIGSGTQIVAPVHIADGATVGAGSTITQDAPANQLTLSRTKQSTVKSWRRPDKKAKR